MKKDPARNLVGKDRFLVLMNGYFLPRSLTASGKGKLSLVYLLFLSSFIPKLPFDEVTFSNSSAV